MSSPRRAWTPKDPATLAALREAEERYGEPIKVKPASGWTYYSGAFVTKYPESRRFGTGMIAYGNTKRPRRRCLWCNSECDIGRPFVHFPGCAVAAHDKRVAEVKP